MSMVPSNIPEACTTCPHIDQFHSTCTHPLRQIVIQELAQSGQDCPIYPEIHSEAMSILERRLDEESLGS